MTFVIHVMLRFIIYFNIYFSVKIQLKTGTADVGFTLIYRRDH
uniref:Uncharacterized protein n=1 Tax=Heterorhabditis bacteriophora TaxID=37862 RepID=A0A1I7X7Y6_HETBA